MPQVRCWNLGLGVDVSFREVSHASGTTALLRQGSSAFYYVPLLSAAAVAKDGARVRHFRKRALASARRDGTSSARLCGDAGACASPDERAPAGNALDGAAEVEAEGGAVLRFQSVQRGKEKGETKSHARESGDSRTGETPERLAVEQLGILPRRSGRARGD